MQRLSCGMWDPVPRAGIEHGPQHWELRVLASGPPVKFQEGWFFRWDASEISPDSTNVTWARVKLLIGIFNHLCFLGAFQVGLVIKNPPANAGDVRVVGSIPGSERSPGGEHGNPHQYACLENPTDRGARGTTVHRIVRSWTRQKWLSTHTHTA